MELKEIAQKYNKSKEEVMKIYETHLKENVEVLKLPKEKAEEMSRRQTESVFKRQLKSGTSTFEGVIFGTDGRISDWAATARKKNLEKSKGMTDEEKKAKNLMDANGQLLYVEDKYRTGVIPDAEKEMSFKGYFQDVDGKKKFTSIKLKKIEDANKMLQGCVVQLEAWRNENQTTETTLSVIISNDVKIKKIGDMSEKDFEAMVKNVAKTFSKPLKDVMRSDSSKNALVLASDQIIMDIKKDLGASKNTLISLSVEDNEDVDSIDIWVGRDNKFPFRAQMPVNLLFNYSDFDKERRSVSGNMIAAWYDEPYKVEKLTPVPAVEEIKTPTKETAKKKEEDEDDGW